MSREDFARAYATECKKVGLKLEDCLRGDPEVNAIITAVFEASDNGTQGKQGESQ